MSSSQEMPFLATSQSRSIRMRSYVAPYMPCTQGPQMNHSISSWDMSLFLFLFSIPGVVGDTLGHFSIVRVGVGKPFKKAMLLLACPFSPKWNRI